MRGAGGDQLLFSWREESGNWQGHATLIVVRPLLPNSLARVEESGLASTEGADAGGEGLADHGGNEASPISRYGTYKFLP